MCHQEEMLSIQKSVAFCFKAVGVFVQASYSRISIWNYTLHSSAQCFFIQ